jgi:hypothetical protein
MIAASMPASYWPTSRAAMDRAREVDADAAHLEARAVIRRALPFVRPTLGALFARADRQRTVAAHGARAELDLLRHVGRQAGDQRPSAGAQLVETLGAAQAAAAEYAGCVLAPDVLCDIKCELVAAVAVDVHGPHNALGQAEDLAARLAARRRRFGDCHAEHAGAAQWVGGRAAVESTDAVRG